jgi:hypothetical protein
MPFHKLHIVIVACVYTLVNLQLVPGCFVHEVQQRLPGNVPLQVLAENVYGPLLIIWAKARNVRREDDVGQFPEGTVLRQRFLHKHIQPGAADLPVSQRADERRFVAPSSASPIIPRVSGVSGTASTT